MTRRPFRIEIEQRALDDLRERLARTRWPHQLDGAEWDYGINVASLRELCDHWLDGYDWRAAEARLNAYDQYLDEVDGLDLHYLHVPSTSDDPFPLLLIHGWPGSIWEFMGTLEGLREDFDLVVVSLPGFGFSGKPTERGWGVTRTAAALNRLMLQAGYERYAAQGGDWGGIISAQIGADHPERCAWIHVNQTFARLPEQRSPEVRAWLETTKAFSDRETGYSFVQRTKPDSLTVAQNDSPAGLAAWIGEKFRTWSDDWTRYDQDDLLTNVMLYWLTESAPSAARLYYEMAQDRHAKSRPPVSVPTAVAHFPAEPFMVPEEMSAQRYNLVRWTEQAAGGHFAALEQPDALVADIRAFHRALSSSRA